MGRQQTTTFFVGYYFQWIYYFFVVIIGLHVSRHSRWYCLAEQGPLHVAITVEADSYLDVAPSRQFHFGVALTTIPPRFSTLHHTIKSWQQQTVVPELIVIFVPRIYRRFRRKKNVKQIDGQVAGHANTLLLILEAEVNMERILIVEHEVDLGPFLKYFGLFEFIQERMSTLDVGKNVTVTHWVAGDDDVDYSSSTLEGYSRAMHEHLLMSESIVTYYKVDVRMSVGVGGNMKGVKHIQGVDTVLFPAATVTSGGNGTFNSSVLANFVPWLHEECPQSFYQDDYIISLLVHASGYSLHSVWNGQSIAGHIDMVSLSNFQMHLNENVFAREVSTRGCLTGKYQKVVEKIRSLQAGPSGS
jgi:hypothetical protein